MIKGKENLGVILVLVSAALWGVFPVLVNQGTKTIPPLTFAAYSTLLAALGSLAYAIIQGKLFELKKKESYYALFMITLCIVVIPYTLFFIGSSMTSGVNSSMLLLAEIIFTLIYTHYIGEKTTKLKLIGAGGIFLGALFILYNGMLEFNRGDILIILSTVTYPIGNFYSKKALNVISPSTILFTRFLLGGLFILMLANVVEANIDVANILIANWEIILLNGFIVFGLSKVAWYEGLKRLDISKAVSLVMTFPLFSIATLIFIYQERISAYQWIGILIMMAGVYFSVRRPSVDKQLTKYAEI